MLVKFRRRQREFCGQFTAIFGPLPLLTLPHVVKHKHAFTLLYPQPQWVRPCHTIHLFYLIVVTHSISVCIYSKIIKQSNSLGKTNAFNFKKIIINYG